MASYNLHVDFTHLYAGLDAIGQQVTTHVQQIVAATAQEVHARWANEVMHAKGVWVKEKKDYVHSLEIAKVHDLYHEVHTEYHYAGEIERGRPGKDLKKMLHTSLKARVAKNGKNAGQRYLIIPFRHNTPGSTAHAPAMPDLVYAHAKKLMRSRVTGQGKRISGTGAFNIKTRKPMLVAQNKYDWGGRLPAGMTPKLKPHHTTDIHAGMVKMGNKGHSQYMTFRVMGEWQTNKWLVPPKPGLFIAQKVAGEMKPAFEKAMSVAVEQMIF